MTVRVAAIVLAAGRGRRFGADDRTTKVVAKTGGAPLVRAVTTSAQSSRAISVTVVSGHAHSEVEAALAGMNVAVVHNARFADGMASSLNAGLAAVGDDADGILVLLADMPSVTVETLDGLIACFEATRDTAAAVVPVFEGQRGNPCLLGRRLYKSIRALRGDEGARHLLSAPDLVIARCEVDDPGVTLDIDTQADLQQFGVRSV